MARNTGSVKDAVSDADMIVVVFLDKVDWTVLDWTGRGGMVMVMVMATVLFSIYSMHGHHCHKK